MAKMDTLIKGLIIRTLTNKGPFTDDSEDAKPARFGRYGEQWSQNLFNKSHGLAEEGSYFVISNTPGTGLATIAAPTTLADTSPFIYLVNTETNGIYGKRTYLDYLRLIATAAGTAGTALRCAVKIDPIARPAPTGAAAPLNPGTPIN